MDREFGRAQPRPFAIAKENGVELAILQIPQPQLRREGNLRRNVFRDKDSGQGVFAKMLMDEGIRVLDAGELPKIILKMRTENVNQTDFVAILTVRCCNTAKRNWKTASLSRYGSRIGAAFCFARHSGRQYTSLRKPLHRW